jgi:hypothetical protein
MFQTWASVPPPTSGAPTSVRSSLESPGWNWFSVAIRSMGRSSAAGLAPPTPKRQGHHEAANGSLRSSPPRRNQWLHERLLAEAKAELARYTRRTHPYRRQT